MHNMEEERDRKWAIIRTKETRGLGSDGYDGDDND